MSKSRYGAPTFSTTKVNEHGNTSGDKSVMNRGPVAKETANPLPRASDDRSKGQYLLGNGIARPSKA